VRRLLVTANVVPNSPILFTLMMEALSSSETSVLTRSTRHNIPEEAILNLLIIYVAGAEPIPLILWPFMDILYKHWMMVMIVEQLVE
jgi:hypothetical protein